MLCKCGGRAKKVSSIVTNVRIVDDQIEFTEQELYQCYECRNIFVR